MRVATALLLATIALPMPTLAQPASTDRQPGEEAPASATPPVSPPATDEFHQDDSASIVITGRRVAREDILSGVSVLTGEQLTQALRPTIGDTLARTPGVSATSFGPSASRPVLRGFQGERVRVLTDGIGSIDVSNTSVDHAVIIDPLLAERIEVLRGPQALLFGSSAVGGVVNVIDRRIPRAVPDETVHVAGIATYGSAANERSVGGAADAAVGSTGFVVHADGSYLKSDDLEIGGYALSPRARREALASAALGGEDADEFAANAAIRDRLPNTASETWTAGAGVALIRDGGDLGVSYSHYDSLYGVPIRYATLPGQEQEAPRLDVKQNRLDARAGVDTGGGILDRINLRAGYASYRHFELEPNGAIGTAFYNKGGEGRLELVQATRGVWGGTTGGQFFYRDFNVVGDEAFLPKNSTEQLGLFTLQTFDFGRLKLEAGGRYERSILTATPLPDQPQFFGGTRRYANVSVSGGGSYGFADGWRAGVSVSRTQRAPSAEELFANGPHAGTQAFEIGNPFLKTERALGVEGVLRGRGRGYTLELSGFYDDFKNFIYETQTGEEEDGLPVFQQNQAGARYYGFEAQGTLTLARFGAAQVVADGLADYVRATVKSVGPVPRIPPLRLLGGMGVTTPKVDVRGEVERVFDQDRIADFETPTDGYTMVNLSANVRPFGKTRSLSFALSANNLFDVDARRHASFLKDFAPLAGRDLRVSARLDF